MNLKKTIVFLDFSVLILTLAFALYALKTGFSVEELLLNIFYYFLQALAIVLTLYESWRKK